MTIIEKQFEVKLTACITPEEEAKFFREEGLFAIETLLHEIAYDGKRFHIQSANKHKAVLYGICSQLEIADLQEELEEYFELRLWIDDEDKTHWQLTVGDEVPIEKYVFEDGEMPVEAVSLTLTFDDDWAIAQPQPPSEMFLQLLCGEMRWDLATIRTSLKEITQTHSHIWFCTKFDSKVEILWNVGERVLQKMSAKPFVLEFEVIEKPFYRRDGN